MFGFDGRSGGGFYTLKFISFYIVEIFLLCYKLEEEKII
jgi:hypothetical protein